MTDEQAHKLRELVFVNTRGNLRLPWRVQTSNALRRIGTDYGDGDVLRAVIQASDGQPDLLAPPAVLDYIVAAQPLIVLELFERRERAWNAIDLLRNKIEGAARTFAEAEAMRCGWSLTVEQTHKLRASALAIPEEARRPWSVQTSNSFRRIGTDRGDGNVLCGVTRSDGQADLLAPPGVLDYIIAAHPFVVLELLDQCACARQALDHLRHKIAGHDEAFAEAESMCLHAGQEVP